MVYIYIIIYNIYIYIYYIDNIYCFHRRSSPGVLVTGSVGSRPGLQPFGLRCFAASGSGLGTSGLSESKPKGATAVAEVL